MYKREAAKISVKEVKCACVNCYNLYIEAYYIRKILSIKVYKRHVDLYEHPVFHL